ncbi:MAG: hypothetical protein EA350_10025 [Gemmatimonadales bacterium]|nr:MAG: hypothetical protein EA350_10025 [Gemmatimonadales bacterium]
MNHVHWLTAATSAFLLLAAPAQGQTDGELDHREDLRMNSISGGDFRDYISRHITEDDRWGHAMRAFGTFHNLMHEMMSDLARHAVEELGHGELVPSFTDRISGGEWGDYRASLEDEGDRSAWMDFVQITEIMHDRVHQAMYYSVLHDMASRDRAVDPAELGGEERAPWDWAEESVDRSELRFGAVSRDRFRDRVWEGGFEGEHLHAAMQKMMVFDEYLRFLMADWAAYGAEKVAAGCRPPGFGARMSGETWRAYEGQVAACDEESWRRFVQVAGLMHDRIQHMMQLKLQADAGARQAPDPAGPTGACTLLHRQ